MSKEVKFTITVSEGLKTLVLKTSQECDVSMAMVAKIAIDHLIKQNADIRKQIIDNYVYRAKLNNMLTKDEQIVIDAKKRIREIDQELKKMKPAISTKVKWEGEEAWREPGEK